MFVGVFFLSMIYFSGMWLNYTCQCVAPCDLEGNIGLRGTLAIHFLTHIFQHTLFDWLKFT